MGIGRRQFLQLFGATITGLTANPSRAIAIVNDQYVNRKLGIAFSKPQGWTFADVKEMGEVREGQILDLDDADLVRELAGSAELPILTISKDRLSAQTSQFTPGVTIYLDRFEWLKAFSGKWEVPPLENAIADTEHCESMFKDFQVVCPPKETTISECDAAEYTARFLFEHVNMQPTRVRMQTLAVYQSPAYYTLRMFDSPFAGTDMEFDYSSFVESVRIV